MALIYPGVKCAICGELLGDEDHMATSGAFVRPDDPLFRYCDAPMHWRCFAAWEHRERFSHIYVDVCVRTEKVNPYWGIVYLDDKIFVTVNPKEPVREVSLRLCSTTSSFRVKLDKWSAWVASDPCDITNRLLDQIELQQVMPILRESFPDEKSVVEKFDFEGKKELHERQKRASSPEAILAYNNECEDLQKAGVVCPYCKTKNVRFVRAKVNTRRSYWICGECNRSFRKEDFVES